MYFYKSQIDTNETFFFFLSITFILQFPLFCKIIYTEEETKSQSLLFVMNAYRYNMTEHKNLIII